MDSFNDNKELKTISIEELKQFDGLDTLSESEAIQIIEALKELALLSYNFISDNNEQLKPTSKFHKAE